MNKKELPLDILIGLRGTQEQLDEVIFVFCEKYGYEYNSWDFDYDRIYTKGYEESDNWDECYVASVVYGPFEDTEEDEEPNTTIKGFLLNHQYVLS